MNENRFKNDFYNREALYIERVTPLNLLSKLVEFDIFRSTSHYLRKRLSLQSSFFNR